MLNQDPYQSATEFSQQALAFMEQYRLVPNPVNYSVAYLYASGQNKALNDELEQYLGENLLTDSQLEQLFDKYLSYSENLEKRFLAPIEKSLAQTLVKLSSQVANEQLTVSNLAKADHALAHANPQSSLQTIVSFLTKTINDSQAQHQQLSDELKKASDEVVQLKSELQETRQEAVLDALTGLLNRRGCDNRLKALAIEDVHTSLAIDIDHFKKVNDNFGHFVGDKVIQRVAKVISEAVSEQDLAVRFGGEEFLVLMVNKPLSQATLVAEKIRQSVADLKLVQRHTNMILPPISVSIGIAEQDHDADWSSLFKRADDALYRAKQSGRNRCVCA